MALTSMRHYLDRTYSCALRIAFVTQLELPPATRQPPNVYASTHTRVRLVAAVSLGIPRTREPTNATHRVYAKQTAARSTAMATVLAGSLAERRCAHVLLASRTTASRSALHVLTRCLIGQIARLGSSSSRTHPLAVTVSRIVSQPHSSPPLQATSLTIRLKDEMA